MIRFARAAFPGDWNSVSCAAAAVALEELVIDTARCAGAFWIFSVLVRRLSSLDWYGAAR